MGKQTIGEQRREKGKTPAATPPGREPAPTVTPSRKKGRASGAPGPRRSRATKAAVGDFDTAPAASRASGLYERVEALERKTVWLEGRADGMGDRQDEMAEKYVGLSMQWGSVTGSVKQAMEQLEHAREDVQYLRDRLGKLEMERDGLVEMMNTVERVVRGELGSLERRVIVMEGEQRSVVQELLPAMMEALREVRGVSAVAEGPVERPPPGEWLALAGRVVPTTLGRYMMSIMNQEHDVGTTTLAMAAGMRAVVASIEAVMGEPATVEQKVEALAMVTRAWGAMVEAPGTAPEETPTEE